MSEDLSRLVMAFDAGNDPAMAARRQALAKQFQDDATRFAKDPKDGKEAISVRARAFEADRSEALERAHSFDNAAAALELGIVLATASAITMSTLLVRFALLMGVVGVTLAALGLTFPDLAAF